MCPGFGGAMPEPKPSTQRRYPPELRERAVRMVLEAFQHAGDRHGVVTRVAQQLGVGPESLRNWVKQTEIDASGRRPRTSCASPNSNARCVSCGARTRS